MLKNAQEFNFANQEMAERTFGRMRDNDFQETTSILSGIHELLSQQPEMSVADAALEIIGDNSFVSIFTRYITSYIGEGQFKNSPFPTIYNALHALREADDVGVRPGVEEPMAAPKPDFSEDLKRVKTQRYEEGKEEDVTLSIYNLETRLLKDLEKAVSPEDIEYAAKQIRETIAYLDSMVEYIPLGREEEEEAAPEEELEVSPSSEKIVRPGKTALSDEELKEANEKKSAFKYLTTTLDLSTAGNHSIISGIDLFPEDKLTPENLEQTAAALDKVFERTQKAFQHFSQVAEKLMSKHPYAIDASGKKTFRAEDYKIDRKILVDFNDLIFAIKAVDIAVENAMRNAIRSEENKGFGHKFSELRSSLLVKRLISDEAFFRRYILRTLAYFVSRDSGLLLAGIKTWDEMVGDSYKDIKSAYSKSLEGRDLLTDAQESIFEMMWPKFKKMLNYKSRDMAIKSNDLERNSPMVNFLNRISFQKQFLAHSLRRKINNTEKGKVSFKQCPACSRKIKWSGLPLKEVELFEARGAYIPLFSIFGRSKDKKRFLVTEKVLRERGPYPPPSPESIGSESVLNKKDDQGNLLPSSRIWRKTREIVSKYEGDKTWDEILELINSNDPNLHEEGLHRRAAALQLIGAEKLRNPQGNPVVKNINSMMFSCPFDKASKTKSMGQSVADFDVKSELETISKLSFPEDEETQLLAQTLNDNITDLYIQFNEAAISGEGLDEIQEQLEEAFDKIHDLAGSTREKKEVVVEDEDENPFVDSGCGIKLTPYSEGSLDMTYGANANPEALRYSWSPKDFSEEQTKVAKAKLAGGYKFSRTVFRCPTLITEPTSSDLAKYKNIAIPKSGPVGMGTGEYVPPANAEGYGEYAKVEPGTFSYLVCGAPTSLSSFDRNYSEEDSIYGILRRLAMTISRKSTTGEEVTKEQAKAAEEVFNFLIKEGIDYVDLSRSLEVAISLGSKRSTANLKKCRIKKIGDMLVTAARKLPSQFAEIEDLVLVCPHGHKFSIKQSVGFSETHSSIRMSGMSRAYSAGKELYTLSGIKNLDKAKELGLIVRAAEGEELKNFSEIGMNNHKVSELAFDLKSPEGITERWKFAPEFIDPIKKNVFSERPGVMHEDVPTDVEFARVSFGSQAAADLVNSENKSDSTSNEEIAFGKIAAAKHAQDEVEEEAVVARAIEGIDPKDLSANIEALARGLRGAIKVAITWNNRALDLNFFNKVVKDSDFNTEGIAEDIVNINGLFYEQEEVSADAKAAVAAALSPRLKSYVVATNPFHGKDTFESAIALSAAALMDATDQVMNDTELEIELDYPSSDPFEWAFEKLAPYFEGYKGQFDQIVPYISHDDERYVEHGKEIAAKTPVLSMLFAIASYQTDKKGQERTRLRESYGKKVFLMAYARYLANAISVIYNECMSPDVSIPSAYIGYDIGLDLSTAQKVLELDSNDLRRINSNPRFTDVNNSIILRNVTAAYNKIISRMIVAKEMATSPIGLAEAKKELLRQSGGTEDVLSHAVFSAAFPMQVLDFSMKNSLFAPGGNIPNSFGIWGKKGKALPQEPGVLPPAMVPVKRSDGSIVLKKDGTPRTIPVYTHPDSNFDNSKFQIGMISKKSEDAIKWPMSAASKIVGINLPFRRDSAKANSKLRNIPIYDFKFVIDIDGTPQDISFLFKRGRGPEQVKMLNLLYLKLDEVEHQRGEALDEAVSSEEEDAINNHFDGAVREIHNSIRNIPLNIVVGQSFVQNKSSLLSDTPKWAASTHPAAFLVSPPEAFALIENVERFKGMLSTEPDQELLMQFVVRVYGLEFVRDVVQEAMNKFGSKAYEIDVQELFDVYIDKATDEGQKTLSYINKQIAKSYPEHLGQFFDLVPSGPEGLGSNVSLMEASIPKFSSDKRSPGGWRLSFENELGSPPSMSKLSSRLNANNAISDFFGIGDDKMPGAKFLDEAQVAMIDYVKAHASGELGEYTTEASLKTEYLKKIAERRKSWERTMLTMGEVDIEVDDLIG